MSSTLVTTIQYFMLLLANKNSVASSAVQRTDQAWVSSPGSPYTSVPLRWRR